jgi:hypothetical protein
MEIRIDTKKFPFTKKNRERSTYVCACVTQFSLKYQHMEESINPPHNLVKKKAACKLSPLKNKTYFKNRKTKGKRKAVPVLN